MKNNQLQSPSPKRKQQYEVTPPLNDKDFNVLV